MKSRPILFSGAMVRAILDDRKKQTRRMMKPQPHPGRYGAGHPTKPSGIIGPTPGALGGGDYHVWDGPLSTAPLTEDAAYVAYGQCPYGELGDSLWVREAFSYDRLDVDRDGSLPCWYWADGNPARGDWTKPKPSIHMPRWASRLTLRITDIRIERLQDISAKDSRAEGLEFVGDGAARWGVGGVPASWNNDPRLAYRALWESISGAGSWDANPWVWVVEFERTADKPEGPQ